MTRRYLRHIIVSGRPTSHRLGWLTAGMMRFPCVLGRSGIKSHKREGDGVTPRGEFKLIQVFWRAARYPRPRTGLPLRQTRPTDGWCDAPTDRNYNRHVTLPYPASCEEMWRHDDLYDLVIDIAWNRGPIAKSRGSAIFLHLARSNLTPTAGCVALKHHDIRRLLAHIGPATRLVIR
jgi:L,D-peptidoglycan transpeptidase YkuD (ErfK/YbiS/YcfS/YnhG family)